MRQKMRKLLLYLMAIPKSIIFNLCYFNLNQALRFPVIVSHRVCLSKLKGQVLVPFNTPTATIRIGFGDVEQFDQARSRTIWSVAGTVKFNGRAKLGHGCKVIVKKNAELIFGHRFNLSAESSIICHRLISFGDYNLVSWGVVFLDTDQHDIFDLDGNILNPAKPIIIKDSVWIACRSTILKGSTIAGDSIVAAGSVVCGNLLKPNCIYGGNPAVCLKKDIRWDSAVRDYI
jgi:acetyltransferase-like isoleucine patch superfamily enzyme